jgi:ABC-type arginine transport system permease subunit
MLAGIVDTVGRDTVLTAVPPMVDRAELDMAKAAVLEPAMKVGLTLSTVLEPYMESNTFPGITHVWMIFCKATVVPAMVGTDTCIGPTVLLSVASIVQYQRPPDM